MADRDPFEITFSDRDGDAVAVASVKVGGDRLIQLTSDAVVQFTPEDAYLLGRTLISVALMEGKGQWD